jgi:hypothetical protein
MEWWSDGVVEWWSVGVMEYWSTGVLEYWDGNDGGSAGASPSRLGRDTFGRSRHSTGSRRRAGLSAGSAWPSNSGHDHQTELIVPRSPSSATCVMESNGIPIF